MAAIGVGGSIALAADEDVYTFEGAGWGHSVGLSQYGAYGQALDGVTDPAEIIGYYYDGVAVETIADLVSDGHVDGSHPLITDPTPVWVGLRQSVDVLDVAGLGGPFDLCRINDDDTTTCVVGDELRIERLQSGGTESEWQCQAGPVDGETALEPGNCRIDLIWGGDGQAERISLDGGACDPAGTLSRDCLRRGILHLRDQSVTEGFHVALELGVEEYLYGLGEMPSSWPDAALRAQAIAGRSFLTFRVLANAEQEAATAWETGLGGERQAACWCHIYSTVRDQNYVGYAKEGSGAAGPPWVAAVDATAGQVITHPTSDNTRGTVIQAFYHSSSGGWTESNETVWNGGPVAYIAERADPWSVDAAVANPFASWTFATTAGRLAEVLGWDRVDAVSLINAPPAATFRFTGRLGGEPVEEDVLAATLYGELGTLSPHMMGVSVDRFFPFLDIGQTVHQAAVVAIWEAGITSGCGDDLYCPHDPVTRAQMATFLARALELEATTAAGFEDVARSGVHAPAIDALAEHGISSGCAPDLFCPDDPVTRAQMATFLARALDLDPMGGTVFSDVHPAGVHARAINAIAEAGISLGCEEGLYCPDDPVTREQMATFLARAFIWSAG